MTEATHTFQYSEALLAERYGISRGDIKMYRDRDLVEGSDWKKVAGEILLSPSGIARLKRLRVITGPFDLSQCLVTGAVKKNGAPPLALVAPLTPDTPREFIITSIPLNPRVVLARLHDPSRGEAPRTCTVDVGRNATFVPGDVIRAVPHNVQIGFWRFVGGIPRSRRRIQGNVDR